MPLPSLSLCRDDLAVENLIFGASTDRNQPQENTDDDKLMKLVSSQNFDGSFKLETSIAQLLDTTTDDITQGIFSHFPLTNEIQYWLTHSFCKMNVAGKKSSYPDQVWVTAIALAYMALALAQLQTSWMLVAKKAEKWLQSQHLADQDACKMAAQEYVQAKLHL